MLTFTEAQVLAWITPILWPFLRVLALFGSLPVIAQRSVPLRLRIGLAGLIAFCAQATIPAIAPIVLSIIWRIPSTRVVIELRWIAFRATAGAMLRERISERTPGSGRLLV